MTTYRTLHTLFGLQRIAQAEATGIQLNLTHMAVGDGNGNAVEPSESQTQLARELYRAEINRVYQDPQNPLKFTAELLIPSDIGGFTIREVGLFDSNGSLLAVANTPSTYKPTDDEGAFSDGVYRMEFLVTNASSVTIQADPAVAVATHLWVINNVTPATLIPGGTTSQLLAKSSNADGDVEWVDPDAVSVVVDTIEERQALVAGQLEVILATTTTYGLAVYVDGVRIYKGTGADEWQPKPTQPEAVVLLGQSYAGAEFLAVQNEPAGSAPFPLIRSSNLSDLENLTTARANLGVYSKADADRLAPTGNIAYTARSTAPTGWLKANGAAISRTAYASLFAAIGTTYGAGDGFNTFNVPDLRGEFVRGWDDGRGVDTGRMLGSAQNGTTHAYAQGRGTAGAIGTFWSDSLSGYNASSKEEPEVVINLTNGGKIYPAGTSYQYDSSTVQLNTFKSRPRNVALLAIIKF